MTQWISQHMAAFDEFMTTAWWVGMQPTQAWIMGLVVLVFVVGPVLVAVYLYLGAEIKSPECKGRNANANIRK